jgi:phage shock protein E
MLCAMKTWMWILVAVGVALVLKHFMTGRASKGDIEAQLAQNTLVVDVRTPAEFQGGHYDGAINIPLSDLGQQLDQFGDDKARSIILYCHSGGRAAAAKRALEQAGYTNVLNAGSLRAMP